MDQRQKKAFYNIRWAANDLLGGLENTLLDYKEDVPLDSLPPTLDAFLVKMCMEHPNATAADIAEKDKRTN